MHSNGGYQWLLCKRSLSAEGHGIDHCCLWWDVSFLLHQSLGLAIRRLSDFCQGCIRPFITTGVQCDISHSSTTEPAMSLLDGLNTYIKLLNHKK